MKKPNPRRRIWITIGLIAIIFLLLAYFVDWDEVLFTLRHIQWEIILLAGFFLVVGIVLITLRWRYVLDNKPKFFEAFHADSIGYLVTLLSPIPGPALRVVALTQTSKVTISSATPAMAIDLLLGVVMRIIALILAVSIGVSLSSAFYSILIGVVLIGAVLGFMIWLIRHPDKFIPIISRLLSRLPGMRGERLEKSLDDLQIGISTLGSIKSILFALLFSLIMSSFFLIFQYLGFLAMPIDLSTQDKITLAAAVLVVLPPSAPAMIGIYQGVLVGFLILFRITDSTTLTAYAILVFAVQLFIWAILGTWAFFRTHLRLGGLIQQSQDAFRGVPTSDGQSKPIKK